MQFIYYQKQLWIVNSTSGICLSSPFVISPSAAYHSPNDYWYCRDYRAMSCYISVNPFNVDLLGNSGTKTVPWREIPGVMPRYARIPSYPGIRSDLHIAFLQSLFT